MGTKKCSQCKTAKLFSAFYKCRWWKDGYQYQCKECLKTYKNKPEAQERARQMARKPLRTERKRKTEDRRYNTDINFRLAKNLRTRLFQALQNNQKAGSAVNDLGCSIQHLKLHLELFWDDGMLWNNWNLNGWHIDHIKPLSSFDLTNREQFLEANHYTNLQPLWAEDNYSKNNREQP